MPSSVGLIKDITYFKMPHFLRRFISKYSNILKTTLVCVGVWCGDNNSRDVSHLVSHSADHGEGPGDQQEGLQGCKEADNEVSLVRHHCCLILEFP